MARKKKNQLPSGSVRKKVYVGIRADGTKRYESFTAKTAYEAERLAAEFRVKVEAYKREGVPVDDIPRDGALSPSAKNKETVSSCLDLYLDTCAAAGLSPSTLKEYAYTVKRAYQELKDVPIADLTLQQIQAYSNARAIDVSPKTVRNEISLLFASIKQARPDLNSRVLKLPKKQTTEIKIPTTEEVRQMLKASEGTPLYIPLLLAALMGLRRSEICALTWDDINVKERYLHINSAVVEGLDGLVRKGTKTRAGERTLPIHTSVIHALETEPHHAEFVTQLTPDAITHRFQDLLAKLSMSYRFHDLRHYHASMMIAVGAPDKYITADMGHASMHMVHRVYGHVMQERQREINEQLARQIDAMNL